MTQFAITSDAQVQPALSKAQAGDTLVFASGRYAGVRTIRRWAAPGITLRPARGARAIMNGFVCDGAAGVTVEGFEIDSRDGVGVMMGGRNPERIVIRNLEIHGAIVDSEAIRAKGGIAVSFGKNAVDCVMADCVVHHVGSGVNGIAMVRCRVTGNRLHDLRGDALHFAPESDLTVEGNEIRDMYPKAGDHTDGIQLTTVGVVAPPVGIVIRRNRLFRGRGAAYQGIFGNNEASLPYRNVLIEENLVACGHYHGITLRMAEAPIIRGNYVTGDAGSFDGRKVMAPWIKIMDSKDAVVTGNTTVVGPIFSGTSVASEKGNKAIKLPRANDATAADAWWAKLTGGAAKLDKVLPLADLAIAAAAMQVAVKERRTRRSTLAQIVAGLISCRRF